MFLRCELKYRALTNFSYPAPERPGCSRAVRNRAEIIRDRAIGMTNIEC
jgi:hypothetical protein